jgi:tetraacyldisaccharide 4'-kinase
MLIKPKFWDYNKPNFLSYLLLPLTIPIKVNNLLLKYKSKKKLKNLKTICLGNIYVGGTGKTPTTIKLYELLRKQNFNVATAKKFYPYQYDEQLVLDTKTIFITEKNRIKIIEKAIQKNIKVIIFDDGLQERKVNYDIQFVCFDSENWIGNGQLIPSGPLRENLCSLKKYDAVFLKNNSSNIDDIVKTIKKYNSKIKIFHTEYKITNLKDFELSKKYLIFSGIGRPQNFKDLLLKSSFNIVDELIYPDHHNYTKSDIDKIKKHAITLNAKIITTEKDFIKIPKQYVDNINFINVDLLIKNHNDLINFIKERIDE